MSLYSQLDRLASDLETVKKQLHAVANTNQLQRSSVEAGSLDFNDEDGNLKAIIGLQHDGATTVNVVNGPKPPTPAGITAAVDNGRIILRWDGTFSGDLIAPTDWARTEIYAQEGDFVVPTPENARGSFVSAAGGELTIGVKRGTWTVCVAAWSQAGRQSEMSVPITVEVPGFGDLVQEAIDKAEALIEEARTTLEAGQAELTDKLGDLTTDLTDLGYDIDLVQLAQSQMVGDISDAQAKADSAFQNAATADSNATAAKSVADQAKADAAAAAGVAGGKADVLIQSTTPATAMRKATTLWIDTTSSTNTPKRWNGTAWVAVTDKAATDAAAAAATAQTKADQAKTAADQAKATADAAQTAASNAQATATQALTSANSKNTITRSTSNPPASYTGRVDDLWWKMTTLAASGRVLGQYRWTGTAWLAEQIDSAVLAYVDAAKITTGFLDVATLIKAAAITVDKLLIGGSRNLLPNGDLDKGSAVGWPVSTMGEGPVYDTTDKPEGKIARVSYRTTQTQQGSTFGRFSVAGMETLVLEAWVKADKPGSIIYVEVRDQNSDHAAIASRSAWGAAEGGWAGDTTSYSYAFGKMEVPTVWTKFRSTLKLAPGTSEVYIGGMYFNHSSGTERDATVSYAGLSLRPMVGGTLIEPGGIQTPHLAADVLDVKNFTAGAGEMNEAVIAKLFSDVVVARMAQAEEFIGDNAILTDSITAPKIVASEELTAKVADFLRVRSEMIEADAIDGMVIRGLTLLAGNDRHRLDDGGYAIFDENGDRRTYLSPEGSSFKGEVEADNLVVNGGAELRGTENILAQGGKLTIAAGVTDPTAPPNVQPYWEGIELESRLDEATGLAFDGTNYWTGYKRSLGGGQVEAYRVKITPEGVVTKFSATSWNEFWGVTAIGSELFWLYKTYGGFSSQKAMVEVTDLNLVKKRDFEFVDIGLDAKGKADYLPGIGNDGTNVVIGHASDNGTLRVRIYNKTTGAQIGSTISEPNTNFAGDVNGIYMGPADDGTTRIYINKRDRKYVYTYTSAGVYDGTRTFQTATASSVGLAFHNGAFHTLDLSTIHRYADSNTGDNSGDWWATYYWYTDIDNDEIIESTDYRSRMAPPKRFTWPRRSMLKILGQPLPSGVEALGPALAKKSTTPVRTDFSGPGWIVDSGKPSARYIVLPTNWTAYASPSSENTYPTATPASIESASGTTQFKGDGSGRIGSLVFGQNGKITSGLLAHASGEVSVTPTGSSGTRTGNAYVTFPAGRFTSTPKVVISALTSVPGTTVVGVGASGTSVNGFTAYLARVNNTTTPLAWIAMEEG
ncbi:minor tail protein [Brevibacterium phage LuckyBarnes]|uniref:Minor tail protein n=1 Tax=Brevibacterium phage LuckyBarnes TaxID=2027888 RepID=A0A249XNP1_9CAUD|nr:minor tail protein [Brevibacterium phage LuckyBarnes]ASZ73345.1 minor tail protein [Brevibacterium phage LuckyBarnes]